MLVNHRQGNRFGGVISMKSPVLFLALSLSLAVPLAAQDGSMDMYISASNSSMMMTNTIIGGATFRSSLKAKLAKKKSAVTATPAPKKVVAPARQTASLNFSPSPRIRNASVERLFTQMRSVDPENAKKIEAQYGGGRLFQALDGALKGYGLTTNNVADSMTVWLINVWMGANGRSDNPSNAEIKAVRNQIADTLAGSPDFANANDAAKQELSDALLVNAAVIGGAVDDPAAKTAEGSAMLKKVTRKLGSDLGLDLTAMKISTEGFAI
jgi:hypothetical protein